MSEVKQYKVSIDTRNVTDSTSFYVNADDEFTLNGKNYLFKEISRIIIADADGNGGWNSPDAIKKLLGK